VFWDLREPFVFHLYHNSVEGARLESILPQFDSVRNLENSSYLSFVYPVETEG